MISLSWSLSLLFTVKECLDLGKFFLFCILNDLMEKYPYFAGNVVVGV